MEITTMFLAKYKLQIKTIRTTTQFYMKSKQASISLSHLKKD